MFPSEGFDCLTDTAEVGWREG